MDDHEDLAGTSTITTRLLLRVAAERGGDEAVTRVLDAAGLTAQRRQLQSLRGRVSYPVKLRLFEAAVRELADPRIGLALGGAALADPALAALRRITGGLGSPAAALRHVSRLSTRLDSAAVFRSVASGDRRADLAWRVLPPYRPSRVDCDYNIGMLAQVPVLFGLRPATVEHSACQVDGAPECAYTVTWREGRRPRRPRRPAAPPADAQDRPTPVGSHTRMAEEWLGGLQEAVTDLVSDVSLEETLDRIAGHAERAVHAPGYVLDVLLPQGERHVRSRGVGTAVLAALGATRLQPGEHRIGGAPVLAVPVASATRQYGALAVIGQPGQAFFTGDVAMLAAFARHAAVGIEMSVLLGEAREQEETARLLLTVARSLAGRRTVREVAQTVSDAVPLLSGADRAAVALWEPGVGSIWIAGLSGWPPDLAQRAAEFMTTTEDSPELCQMVAVGAPMLVDRTSSPWARDVLADFGVTAMGGVPIKVGDRLVGIVLAYWVQDTAPVALGETRTERLWGLAGLAGVAVDNTRLVEEIRHQTMHDALTDLPNRTLLEIRVEEALDPRTSSDTPVAVLFCDVSRLRRVNDSLGHGAGDEVLQQVAGRLRSVVRDRDTVARYSGDQFALLLPGSDRRAAERVACRIHDVLASPVSAGDERVFADVVIGIAVTDAAGTRQPGHTARDLLRQANEDMYRTKTRASAAVVHEAPSPDRLRLETDLHGAVSRGEVLVHYQPQVDVPSGRVVGVEALARWTHPILGPVPPDAFIPLAEASGLIGEIGEHVLRAACRTLAGWRAAGLDLEVAVNVSAIQLADPDFNRLVESVLAEEGLPPHLLTLEVTESQVLSDVAISHGHLGRLRDIGVGISVDDFGTGYSSLVQLQRLPVTELKVDRAFTSQLSDRSSSPVVAGIVGLGHGLGLRVVAEGVETPAQLELLRELGCERAQGWLTGRPVPPEELSVQLLVGSTAERSSLGTGDYPIRSGQGGS